MAPPVIVVEKNLDPGFLKHLRRQQKYGSFRIFKTLAVALPEIEEHGFQSEGILFIGADVAVDDGMLNPDRIIRIFDWKTKREAEAEAELKGFSLWIFPETEFVNATILSFRDPFADW